ncbi:hypothetical protein [Streptococcus sp. Marseille-Q3604]|uniref:hypothetical protein n=1 Tax=Streptococcus sp. Marseille-Q3604 TaxID=2866597 RepID=UPI001CE4B140|nr:hypothetical protein [Streptococcus sp. Marseille-Q3604]
MNEVAKSEKQKEESIKKNLQSFDLFKNKTDIKSHNIFEISSPFEQAPPNIIDESFPFDISNLFDTKGNALFNFSNQYLNPNTKILDSNNATLYEVDFDSLTPETKAKLQDGTYKIGESRKVEGNLRAVIVDTTDHKNRVEDLTLRKATNNNENLVPNDLIAQAQLKQIYNLLLDIKESQDYQIRWDRNNSILRPFFSARTKVIEANNSKDFREKVKLLKKANTLFEESVSAIKSDIISNRDEIIKKINQPTYLQSSLQKHADFLLHDIEIMTKIVGIQIYIDLTLNNEGMAHDRLLSFQGSMELVSKQNIPYKTNSLKELAKKLPYVKESKWIKNNSIPKVSLLELIHNHYSYSKNNRDLFINVNTKLIEFQQASNINLSNTETAKIETEKKNDTKNEGM